MEPNYRRCVSCRHLAPKQDFWRIVRVYPSAEVCLDEGSGRSAYLCPQLSCLELAQKKNRLGRALKTSVPPVIYLQLRQRLSPLS
uniref:YlxR domain-containing protein n=1 Tax=Cyanothece sp. (strain PCC 7425 / ATCC 29141) TaxID=395961 RepID=B8HUA8_CYAP4